MANSELEKQSFVALSTYQESGTARDEDSKMLQSRAGKYIRILTNLSSDQCACCLKRNSRWRNSSKISMYVLCHGFSATTEKREPRYLGEWNDGDFSGLLISLFLNESHVKVIPALSSGDGGVFHSRYIQDRTYP